MTLTLGLAFIALPPAATIRRRFDFEVLELFSKSQLSIQPRESGNRSPPAPSLIPLHFRLPYDLASVSRQNIADGHPRSVGSVKNQHIS